MNIHAVSAYIQAERTAKPQQENTVRQQQERYRSKEKHEEAKAEQRQHTPNTLAHNAYNKAVPERMVFTQHGAVVQNYMPKGTIFDKVG